MQYIATEYKGPTNTRGSRIIAKASVARSRKVVPFDYALSVEANHREAAKALAASLNWDGTWVAGHGPEGNVYVNTPAAHEQQDGFTVPRL